MSFASSEGVIDVCHQGEALDFDETLAKKILSENEVKILVTMKEGPYTATALGCDLSYDYVKINGDYRS